MGDGEIKGRQREVNNNIESYTIKNEEHGDEYEDGKIEQEIFEEEIFEKESDKDVENKFTMAKKTKEDNFKVLRMTNEDLQYIPMRDWKEVTEVGSEKYCETSNIEWEGGEVCRLLAELRNFCTCDNTDVLVECRGRRMPCHSGFLRARSNTLRRMLESPELQEDQVKVIELDMEPSVVEARLDKHVKFGD